MRRILPAVIVTLVLSACSTSTASTPELGRSSQTPAPAPTEPTAAPNVQSSDGQAGPCVLAVSRAGWKTDFSRCSPAAAEIRSGGPPKDGIPPVDRPRFISPAQAGAWLKDNEPVVVYEERGEARAYPLQILIWHEIVNDEVGGRSVSVTFCPLCNTAIAFDRRLEGRLLDFGTTGNLRYSDLVMYDRQTESWWQQITGEALVGELTGKKLTPLPAPIVSFAEFKSTFAVGTVLSRETGHSRSYGSNPYVGYDSVDSSPFLYSGPKDERLRPMERVVAVSLGGEDAAYPFSALEQRRVVHDTVGGKPIVLFFGKGTSSALDSGSIAASRDIGAAGVFEPAVDGKLLTFEPDGERIVDAETGSTWSLLGQATGGPLAGKRLTPVVHGTHFWFAWAVFKPQTKVSRPG